MVDGYSVRLNLKDLMVISTQTNDNCSPWPQLLTFDRPYFFGRSVVQPK